MVKKVKAVIFDLDGTLIRLPVNYVKLFQEFSKILKTSRIKPVNKTIARLDAKTRQKIFEVWNRAELEALPKFVVKDEGMRLYREFSESKLALVTMQGRVVVEKILSQLGIPFDIIVTRENSLVRAQQIRTVIKRFRLKPQEVLMIGDKEIDRVSSQEVGCQFLMVKQD